MIDNNYISILVEDYIDFKKGLGFELKICARRLRSFASYTRSLDYTGYISKDIALNGAVWVQILQKQKEDVWKCFDLFNSLHILK